MARKGCGNRVLECFFFQKKGPSITITEAPIECLLTSTTTLGFQTCFFFIRVSGTSLSYPPLDQKDFYLQRARVHRFCSDGTLQSWVFLCRKVGAVQAFTLQSTMSVAFRFFINVNFSAQQSLEKTHTHRIAEPAVGRLNMNCVKRACSTAVQGLPPPGLTLQKCRYLTLPELALCQAHDYGMYELYFHSQKCCEVFAFSTVFVKKATGHVITF